MKKMASEKKNKTGENESLDNGYPFRDDIINFHLKYKGKKYYFEFPVLMDRSFLLREIKARTKVRGTFSLQWNQPPENGKATSSFKTKTNDKENKSTKDLSSPKKEEFCLHSTNITTLSLKRFCGETLHIVDRDGSPPKPIDYLALQRKLIEERIRPFDCPP